MEQIDELKSNLKKAEFKNYLTQNDLLETKSLLESSDRLRAGTEADLQTAAVDIDKLTGNLNSLLASNKNLESARSCLEAKVDDALAEVKKAEERAKRAYDDAARLAEELRQEQVCILFSNSIIIYSFPT